MSPPPIPIPGPRAALFQTSNAIWSAYNQRVQLIARAGRELDDVLAAVAHQANQLGSLTLSEGSGPSLSVTPEMEVGREDGEEVPE